MRSRLWIICGLELIVTVMLSLAWTCAPDILGPQPGRWLLWFLAPLLIADGWRSSIVGFGLLVALHTHGRWLHGNWLAWLLAPAGVALVIERLRGARPDPMEPVRERLSGLIPVLVLLVVTLLYLFGSPAIHRWFYFLDWMPDQVTGSRVLKEGMIRFMLFTVLLTPFTLRGRRRDWVLPALILGVSAIAAFHALLKVTHGLPLYRDDHPSFIFRLYEFQKTFPQLTNYIPHWNGGVVHIAGVTSGIGGLGLLFWPVWKWMSVMDHYTAVVGVAYVFLVPLLAVLSLRAMGASRAAMCCAGILALGVSRHFFLWLLHFGTVGAVFSSACVLPFSACLYRIVWLRRHEKRTIVFLLFSALMLIQWPPGMIMGGCVALGLLTAMRRWSWRSIGILVACGAAVLLLQSRQILTTMTQGESLMNYVMDPERHPMDLIKLETAGWNLLLAHLHEGHPLLLFLGLAGVFALRQRSVTVWVLPGLLGLAFLTGWGPGLKPNLQLGRMSIPLLFLAIIPASLLLGDLLRSTHPRLAVVRAGMLALLILTGINVGKLYGNKGNAPYVVPGEQVRRVVEWIRTNVPPGSRVLFAGSTVHGIGRGHVAALPIMTGREMLACDYYHFPVGTVEYDFPPRQARGSAENMARYMALYNVAAVITFRENWKEGLEQDTNHYENVADIEGRSIFRVRAHEPSLFLEGRGTVTADFNRLVVHLEDPSKPAVLKYNWYKELTAPAPVRLAPFDAGMGVTLIRIEPNGTSDFMLRYHPQPHAAQRK